jgi:hypothetical protein
MGADAPPEELSFDRIAAILAQGLPTPVGGNNVETIRISYRSKRYPIFQNIP